MLPHSLFSESSLKTDRVPGSNDYRPDKGELDNAISSDNGSPPPSDSIESARDSHQKRKRNKSKKKHQHHRKSRRKSPSASSSSSSSSSSSDSGTEESDEDHHHSRIRQQRDLHELQLKLQRQYAKQAKNIEKTRMMHKHLEKTNRQIERLTRRLTDKDTKRDELESSESEDVLDEEHISYIPDRPAYCRRGGKSASASARNTARRSGDPFPAPSNRPSSAETDVLLPQNSTSLLSPSMRTSSLFTRLHTKPDDNLQLGSRNVCDLYLLRHQEVNSKGLQKKPRSLLLNMPGENADTNLKELMMTTSLAGDLQFWNSSTRRNIKTLEKKQLFRGWVEELCWATPTTLALCPSKTKKEESGPSESVVLVHVTPGRAQAVNTRVQALKVRPHDSRKEFTTIAPIHIGQIDAMGNERASFVTGGSDKLVYLWELERSSRSDDFQLKSTKKLNVNHTNSVQALCYSKHNNRLYSGGADDRLISLDFETHYSMVDYKLQSRINHIHQSPTTPDLLLLSLSQKRDQFMIYDQRCRGPEAVRLQFGYSETDNMSRYVRPDWHQNGYMVVCGNDAKVHFWDLRYANVTHGSCFSFDTQAKSRVLRSLFLPGRDTLVSVSSMRAMTWTDYSVQPDGQLHSLSENQHK